MTIKPLTSHKSETLKKYYGLCKLFEGFLSLYTKYRDNRNCWHSREHKQTLRKQQDSNKNIRHMQLPAMRLSKERQRKNVSNKECNKKGKG